MNSPEVETVLREVSRGIAAIDRCGKVGFGLGLLIPSISTYLAYKGYVPKHEAELAERFGFGVLLESLVLLFYLRRLKRAVSSSEANKAPAPSASADSHQPR